MTGEKPYSEAQQRAYSVDSSDADFVDIVQTNVNDETIFKGLGQVDALGHVNFYVNDGVYQPDCIPSVYKGLIKNYLFNTGDNILRYAACSALPEKVTFGKLATHWRFSL